MNNPPMNACSVRYTSFTATCCFNTLSRSTSTNSCGTLGKNVVLRFEISGRFLAAVKNVFTLFARNSTSAPERSSSANVKPPEVPTPGIDGGENENAMPSGSCDNERLMCCLISCNCTERDFRSSHGFSVTKKNPL